MDGINGCSGVRVRRLARVGILPLVALLALGGCKQNQTNLADENLELRDKLDQTQSALQDCETERARILAENERLRGGARGSGPAGATGFEGMGDVSRESSDIVVAVAGDVLFDPGSVVLKASAKQNLDRIAGVLQSQYSSNQVRIAGHTDSDPIRKSGWKTNERLSAERALAVEEYLATRGINKDRMYIAGFGPSKPKGDKKSSRRVEIIVIGSGGS